MGGRILQELCSRFTAPFAERYVVEYVEQFVRQRPVLGLSRDASGNLLIELPARRRGGRGRQSRWVFAAHMDHPGFVARRMIDAKTLEARFHGYVLSEYVKGARVRFRSDDRQVAGTVVRVTDSADRRREGVPQSVHVSVRQAVEPGSPGMFDQGEGRTRGSKFFSRVCDDLAGAAAALEMLGQLLRKPARVPVAVLLTRAEEEGFIGAIAAATKPKLLRKTDRIIAIECSAMQPYAPQGKGAIIRVGDRTSIFNSSLTYFLTQQAEALAKRDKAFQFQRALMPGGTCEATVYDVYGFAAASICVALGNYHNMDRARKKIAPEYVNLADWQNMVKLFVHVAHHAHEHTGGHDTLKMRIEKRFGKLQHFLV